LTSQNAGWIQMAMVTPRMVLTAGGWMWRMKYLQVFGGIGTLTSAKLIPMPLPLPRSGTKPMLWLQTVVLQPV